MPGFQLTFSTDFPASMLWMHPSVVCLCDREAVCLAAL